MKSHDKIAIAPPADVQQAFGARGSAERFPSGEGRTFRIGQLVLKPAGEPHEAEWIGNVLERVAEKGCALRDRYARVTKRGLSAAGRHGGSSRGDQPRNVGV